MKYIKKMSSVELPKINGSVVDTFNVEDKTTNAPSVRAVENKLSYSLEEKQIGYWIDGKPFYRKVIQGRTPSSTGGDVASYDATHDVKLFYGTINQSGGAKWSVPCYFNSTINGSIQFNGNTHKINFFGGSATLGQPIEIVYLYTKTTD